MGGGYVLSKTQSVRDQTSKHERAPENSREQAVNYFEEAKVVEFSSNRAAY